MTRYEVHLDGVHARDLPLGVLRDLSELLVEGASRAVRLAAEGRSTARGSSPIWLTDASDLRLTELREGSLALHIEAAPLVQLAPSVFASSNLDTPVAEDATSFDLLMGAIDDALRGRLDSDRLDFGMLQTLAKSKSLLGRGATRLRFTRSGGRSVELSEAEIRSFQKLATETPAPSVHRLVGALDSLTISTRTAIVKLEDDVAIKGSFGSAVNLEQAKVLLGSEVVLEGVVGFRPSSRPQRIEIDYIAAASARDQIWKRVPKGERGLQLDLPTDELSSYFGQWPGEEDDEEVFAALREMA